MHVFRGGSLTVVSLSLGIEIVLWCVLAGSILLIAWAMRVYRTGLIKRAVAIGKRIPFVKKRVSALADEKKDQIEELDHLISNLYNNRRSSFYYSLGFEVVSRLIGCMEIYIMLYSVGADVTVFQSIIIVAYASLFANLLFFSPMQLGTREGGYVLALRMLSMPIGLGVYIGLCARMRELFWIVVGVAIMKYKSLK